MSTPRARCTAWYGMPRPLDSRAYRSGRPWPGVDLLLCLYSRLRRQNPVTYVCDPLGLR